jgi:L-glutamine-phosphate cytidylyltransferase
VGKLRAAVLAAGRGVRMGGLKPKTLIPAGDNEPLLHYLLVGLEKAGVEDLLVVTGFKADEVQEFVSSRWGKESVQFVFNARFASWGNFHSVRLAVDQSPGHDLLVVNSDIVIHPDVIRRVSEADGDLVLAVDRRDRLDQEDMRVELRGNRVAAIGKDLKPARSHGEYVGVSLMRHDAARLYADLSTQVQWTATTRLYYEDVYSMMLESIDARSVVTRPGEYAEVDVPEDLQAAATIVERLRPSWDAPAGTTVA